MTLDEELNGPSGPTQVQIDRAFIKKLMLTIGECHYAVNRSSPGMATDKIREVITELKGDPEWRSHFKKMGEPGPDGFRKHAFTGDGGEPCTKCGKSYQSLVHDLRASTTSSDEAAK